MWEVLVSGLHVCFLRCVSDMAWVNKGELLSILKSIVQSESVAFILHGGRDSLPQSHSSSLLEQEGSCSSRTARCDSEEK